MRPKHQLAVVTMSGRNASAFATAFVPLMRGNWIFIAFDDCHFSNKTVHEPGRKWDLVFDADKEFHYCSFRCSFGT